MKVIVLLCLVAIAFAGYANVLKAGSTRHLSKWILTGQSPSPHEEVVLGFALKQNNLEKLDDLFWSVSDPSSASYGKYLSNDELGALVGSDEETIYQITNWINENNGRDIRVSVTKDYVWVPYSFSDHFSSPLLSSIKNSP
jgi:uncharacterized protein with WD repeat